MDLTGSKSAGNNVFVNNDSLALGSGSMLSLVYASVTNSDSGIMSLSASSGGTTTITGNAESNFANQGTLNVSGGGLVTISESILNSGLISASTGTLQFLSAVANNGILAESGGSLVLSGAVDGTGTLTVGSGAAVSLLGGASSGETVDLLTSGGDLTLKSPLSFLGTIAGFGGSDVITLTKTAETGYGFSDGVLTISDGTSSVASLVFAGSYTQQNFSVITNAHGNTIITYS